MITAKKYWIMETARLNQPIHFKNTLTSKWKSKCVLLWESGYYFINTGNERRCIHSRLKMVRFGQRRTPENSDCRHKEINLKKLQNI